MPRRRPDDRFSKLLEAATAVFIEAGYRRTQMADVAAAMGVAKGTLYLYVASKAALFDASLRYVDSSDSSFELPTLPVATPRPEQTLEYVREELARQSALPSLDAALKRNQVADGDAGPELAGILSELFDVLARNRRRIKLLDRSARDFPEIAALWSDGARAGLFGLLETYLDDRVRREMLRGNGDTAVTARFLLETLVFWAVHRHWDLPTSTSGPGRSDQASVKTTIVELLVRSVTTP